MNTRLGASGLPGYFITSLIMKAFSLEALTKSSSTNRHCYGFLFLLTISHATEWFQYLVFDPGWSSQLEQFWLSCFILPIVSCESLIFNNASVKKWHIFRVTFIRFEEGATDILIVGNMIKTKKWEFRDESSLFQRAKRVFHFTLKNRKTKQVAQGSQNY